MEAIKKQLILLGKNIYNPHIKHHTIKEDFQLNWSNRLRLRLRRVERLYPYYSYELYTVYSPAPPPEVP